MVLMAVYLVIDMILLSSVHIKHSFNDKNCNKLLCFVFSEAWMEYVELEWREAEIVREREREPAGRPAGHGFGRRSRRSQWRAEGRWNGAERTESFVRGGGGGGGET